MIKEYDGCTHPHSHPQPDRQRGHTRQHSLILFFQSISFFFLLALALSLSLTHTHTHLLVSSAKKLKRINLVGKRASKVMSKRVCKITLTAKNFQLLFKLLRKYDHQKNIQRWYFKYFKKSLCTGAGVQMQMCVGGCTSGGLLVCASACEVSSSTLSNCVSRILYLHQHHQAFDYFCKTRFTFSSTPRRAISCRLF